MPLVRTKIRQNKPMKTIALSFLLVIIVGTIILSLPISSRQGDFTPLLDSLFTATSATCVTGLIVYDTYTHWNVFGQTVILLMIQIGGLGLVTFATFFNFALGKKLGLRSMQLASESVNSGGFGDVKMIVRSIIKISLICEGIGAAVLMTVFVPEMGAKGIFTAVFISVSAFCNAGFDILGFQGEYISLTGYADNPIVMITVMVLIISGGLGFLVWHDIVHYRRTKKLLLHTKTVLIMTAFLIVLGTASVMIFEWNNPETLGGMTFLQKFSRGIFQSVTYRTAGFNTIDNGAMYTITKLFASAIMFIGAAPGSTAGGVKVTTFAVIIMTVISVIKNKGETVVMGRKIEKEIVYKALSIIVLAGMVVLITAGTLVFTNTGISGIDSLFESVSAFATVGVSAGPTAVANSLSRLLLAITMFIGRVGPVSFAIAIAMKSEARAKNQVIPEGKIFVG